jgi:hypothetical protein
MQYLTNHKVDLKDLVVTDQSAMVVYGQKHSCLLLDITVLSTETFSLLEEVFPNSISTLDEKGNPVLEASIIKSLPVKFTIGTVEETTTVEGIQVLDNGYNVARLEQTSPRDYTRVMDRIQGKITTEDEVEQLRAFYRGVEDLTDIRIQSGQRILSCFKHKLGVSPGEDEEKIANKLKAIEDNYNLLTDGVVKLTQASFAKAIRAKATSVVYIDSFSEALMVSTYLNIKAEEELAVKRLSKLLESIPIWNEYLVHIKGCGPKMGAAIISGLNIEAARYPSSFWKYLGLDVTVDPSTGEKIGRRNWTRLMGEAEFLDSKGSVTKASNLGYNAKLKSKLLYVMGGCMLKTNGYYSQECYAPYKNRLENREDLKDVIDEKGKVTTSNKGRRHAMALRYMVKIMLLDLHIHWSELVGKEVPATYGVAKLGMKEHSRRTFRECLAMANLKGGKPEDYIGPITGEEPVVPGVVR